MGGLRSFRGRSRNRTPWICRAIAVVLLLTSHLALPVSESARAQDVTDPGWYDNPDDGCAYYFDGSDWTGEVDCDHDGVDDSTQGGDSGDGGDQTYDPGWYDDPFGDGCAYYFDGSDWTAADCDHDGIDDATQGGDSSDGGNGSGGTTDGDTGGDTSGDDSGDNSGNADTSDGSGETPTDEPTETPAAEIESGWYTDDNGCQYHVEDGQYTGEMECSTPADQGWAPGCYQFLDGPHYWDGSTLSGVGCPTVGDGSAPAGWYDGFPGDACAHYWDGSDWTDQVDCDHDGRADKHVAAAETATSAEPGWYDGLVKDGCSHYWNGSDWTAQVDCNHDGHADTGGADGKSAAPGWYDGWIDDGCAHYWDGSQWTDQIDCGHDGKADDSDQWASASSGWYDDFFPDRCAHFWNGTSWSGEVDCNHDGKPDPAGVIPSAASPTPATNGCGSERADDQDTICPQSPSLRKFIEYVKAQKTGSGGIVIQLTPAGYHIATTCNGAAKIAALVAKLYKQIPLDKRAKTKIKWRGSWVLNAIAAHAIVVNDPAWLPFPMNTWTPREALQIAIDFKDYLHPPQSGTASLLYQEFAQVASC